MARIASAVRVQAAPAAFRRGRGFFNPPLADYPPKQGRALAQEDGGNQTVVLAQHARPLTKGVKSAIVSRQFLLAESLFVPAISGKGGRHGRRYGLQDGAAGPPRGDRALYRDAAGVRVDPVAGVHRDVAVTTSPASRRSLQRGMDLR